MDVGTSVSAKTVLNDILHRLGFVTNTKTGHLSKTGWQYKKSYCSTCDECTLMTDEKRQLLDKAFRIYMAV